MTDCPLIPFWDRVVIVPAEAEATYGSIIIPDPAKQRPTKGEVVAVGPGRFLDSGVREPMEVEVGDVVWFTKYGGTTIAVGDVEYLVVREHDIYVKEAGR